MSKAGPPATAKPGLILVINGTGLLGEMTNDTPSDGPPPGVGLNTVILDLDDGLARRAQLDAINAAFAVQDQNLEPGG
jgi:hypothetical protein